jgi:excisionase family DNA binding protein
MEASEFVITPGEQTTLQSEDVQRAEDELRAYLQVIPGGKRRRVVAPKLLFEDGRQVELPSNIFQALRFVVHHMRRGDAISLVPTSKMLTTNQAADILNVSRPFLVKLLNDRAIPFTKVGTHHRLRMRDVIEYKQRRDREMLKMLDELANEAQEAGNYFEE